MTIQSAVRVYKSVGPCNIRADLYWAAGKALRPAILWIHGGALISGDRRRFAAARQDQLARYLGAGFAVVNIDYRLAPETKLPDILEDAMDALRWTREKAPRIVPIDPDRIALIGHSAGGYLSLLLGYAATPRPRAIVSFYGYGDIRADWYLKSDPFYSARPRIPRDEALSTVGIRDISRTTKAESARRGRFYLYCRQNGLWPREVAGARIARDPDALDRYCPVRNVSCDFPPTLLLHGDSDTDVPCTQSALMAKAFKRAGVPHDLRIVPGGGHGQDGIYDFDRILAFLKTHCGGV